MRLRTCSALLHLLLLSACATTAPDPKEPVTHDQRLANLQRAATLPWADEGRCVVQEASNEWPVLVERCFHALDHDRIRFHDPTGRCTVASADAAAMGLGVCVLVAPEIVVGAVIVTGAVVVAVAIKEELDEHAWRRRANPEEEASSGKTKPVTEATPEEPQVEQSPAPRNPPSGRDWLPPSPIDPSDRRPECVPRRVPPKGGHPGHNDCADNVPNNAVRGANALVNGKAFDALQPAARTLWEIKTDNFDSYPPDLQDIVIRKQGPMLRGERDLARACGFEFRVGVRSAEHRAALERDYPDLKGLIVVMDWC